MSRYIMQIDPTSIPEIPLAALVETLQACDDLLLAYLFGSAAAGRLHPESDLDIAVLFIDRPASEERLRRRLQLMAMLEPLTTYPIQVVTLDDAPPLLAYAVMRDGIILYERDRASRVAFEVRAMKLYFDVRPMLERQYQAMAQRLKEGRFGQGRHHQDALDAARRLHRRIARAATD